MLNQQKTTRLATGAFALSLALAPIANADDPQDGLNIIVDTKIEQTKQDQIAEKRKQILEEATAAIRETQNALKALDEKSGDEAIAALDRAIGKLEIILARDPDLVLTPSGVGAVTYDVLAGIDEIKEVRDQAEDALDDGRVQEARRLIRDLASETVISIVLAAAVNRADCNDAGLLLCDRARDHRLQRDDDLRGDQHRVDALVRRSAVRADTVDDDVDRIRARCAPCRPAT